MNLAVHTFSIWFLSQNPTIFFGIFLHSLRCGCRSYRQFLFRIIGIAINAPREKTEDKLESAL